MPARQEVDIMRQFDRGTRGGTSEVGYAISENIKRQVSVCHDSLHLLSRSEAQEQLEYADQILRDPQKLQEAASSYSTSMVQQTIGTNKSLYENAIKQLDEAMSSNIISSKSYGEWIQWLHDENRPAHEKTKSIRSELERYLKEREPLAAERATLRKDPKISNVSAIKDDELRGMVETLGDDDMYFNKLDLSQRKNLLRSIHGCISAMKGGDAHTQKYKDLRTELLREGTGSQPAFHRDRVGEFLEKVFSGDPTPKEIDKRIETLRGYIKTWRAVNIKFWKIRQDNAFKGIKMPRMKTSAFLSLSRSEREAHVTELTAERERAMALKARARTVLQGASKVLDASGPERWFREYVFNGQCSLDQLESIVDGTLLDRLEDRRHVLDDYDKFANEARMKGAKITFPQRTAFLSQHFRQQLATVQDMEEGIWEWEETSKKEKDAKKLADKEPKNDAERKDRDARRIVEEMREILDLVPSEHPRKFYEEALAAGAQVFRRFGRQMFNLKWAKDKGYIKNQSALDNLYDASFHQTETILRRGHSKNMGESVNLSMPSDHQKKAALRDYHGTWTWTVEHINCEDAAARHKKVDELKSENEARDYWKDINMTNLSLQQQGELVTTVNWRLKSLVFKLEALGFAYTSFGAPASLN